MSDFYDAVENVNKFWNWKPDHQKDERRSYYSFR